MTTQTGPVQRKWAKADRNTYAPKEREDDGDFFKHENGKAHRLRIIPAEATSAAPAIVEEKIHRKMVGLDGNQKLRCPQTADPNAKCAICEEGGRIWRNGGTPPVGDPRRDLAKAHWPNSRHWCNVIDREDPTRTIHRYQLIETKDGGSWNEVKKLLNPMLQTKDAHGRPLATPIELTPFVDPSDPFTGCDMLVTRTEAKPYARYDCRMLPPSPLGDDALDPNVPIPDLAEILKVPSYEDTRRALHGGKVLGIAGPVEEPGAADAHATPPSVQKRLDAAMESARANPVDVDVAEDGEIPGVQSPAEIAKAMVHPPTPAASDAAAKYAARFKRQ